MATKLAYGLWIATLIGALFLVGRPTVVANNVNPLIGKSPNIDIIDEVDRITVHYSGPLGQWSAVKLKAMPQA